MNTLHSKLVLVLTVTLLILGAIHSRSENTAATSAATAVVSNSVPHSIFESNLPNGRDPFFPRSGRRAAQVSSTTAPAADISSLVLQGFSNAANRPMATINNQTFKPGEESEVVTRTGRLRIRCEEIKAESVVITVAGGQRLELTLPQR